MCLDEPTPRKKGCYSDNPKKNIVYHPSDSKKGIPIKGTNIRMSIFVYYEL